MEEITQVGTSFLTLNFVMLVENYIDNNQKDLTVRHLTAQEKPKRTS